MKPVFLDHNATTFPSKTVVKALANFSAWGNPSSIHQSGQKARSILTQARRQIAKEIGCAPGEVIFTSGGSESNNLAIKGMLDHIIKIGRPKIISSVVEHPSVFNALKDLDENLIEVIRVPVTKEKGFDYEFLEEKLRSENVGLVSVMTANNETGEVFDIDRIVELAKKYGSFVHSDMVQTLGKLPVDLLKTRVDLASFSAHKFYSLKGLGVLFQRKGTPLLREISGGGQERGRRAGTENVLAAVCLGEQIKSLSETKDKVKAIKLLRDLMETRIKSEIGDVEVLCEKRERLSNSSMLFINGVEGETLLMNMDLKGYEISTGAACSSGNPEPSPVLIAMGLTNKEASCSMRLSLGWETTEDEINGFVDTLKEVVKRLRSLT